ncbi:glycosyltransferase [Candidatus Pelagibacter sp.]|mgnify:CR=1 FL=1|nr:glycosyltransferase [Candidatus Pelagibacter sp.]
MIIQPSVTVIIPYKNNFQYLTYAINSVLKQKYKNYKILLIYDNDNKNDLFKIQKFLKLNLKKKKSKNIKIYINNKNLGAGISRNIGIKKSNTKYVAFLDADDIWAKNKLSKQIKFMEDTNLVFSHTSYFIIDKKNKTISSRVAPKIITFNRLLRSCDIGLSTVIVNTDFLKQNNYYFPKIKTKEDFVLWLKIVQKIKFIKGLNKKLVYYRKTKNSLSSNKITSLINGYRVYKTYMNYNIIKSLYFLSILSLNYLKKNFLI